MNGSSRLQSLALGAALIMLAMCSACGLNDFTDSIDTEFKVPAPEEGFFGLEPYSKTKRFKLGRDPRDAERAEFIKAQIQVLAPPNADLSYIDALEVYVEQEDKDPILLADAEGFEPGQRSRVLDIVYDGDIRSFVTDDRRVRLTWVVYPSTFAPAWPEDGITIRTDATVLITIF